MWIAPPGREPRSVAASISLLHQPVRDCVTPCPRTVIEIFLSLSRARIGCTTVSLRVRKCIRSSSSVAPIDSGASAAAAAVAPMMVCVVGPERPPASLTTPLAILPSEWIVSFPFE